MDTESVFCYYVHYIVIIILFLLLLLTHNYVPNEPCDSESLGSLLQRLTSFLSALTERDCLFACIGHQDPGYCIHTYINIFIYIQYVHINICIYAYIYKYIHAGYYLSRSRLSPNRIPKIDCASLDGITQPIRRTAVRETGVSSVSWRPHYRSPNTPRTSQHYDTEVFQRGSQLLPHFSKIKNCKFSSLRKT